MKSSAPLLTLAAVAALGVGFLVANTVNHAGAGPRSATSGIEQPATATGPTTPTPQPEAGGPPEGTVTEKAYAGWSAGRELSVAIAVKDGRAVGYVCDGTSVEAWLEGTQAGGTLSLESKDGSSTITATADGSSSEGTVTVGGTQRPFTAEGVTAPAGLYEGRADVRGVATRVGWVVSGAGDVTGVASAAGERRPAPRLNPAAPGSVTLDGVPVAVTPLDGGATVIRR